MAHLMFVIFVVVGGLLVWRWRRLIWLHLPAVTWGALIEFTHVICPLTPLEKQLRVLAGQQGYEGGFITHYIIPVLYPAGLTHGTQVALGACVVVLNVAVYTMILRRRRPTQPS